MLSRRTFSLAALATSVAACASKLAAPGEQDARIQALLTDWLGRKQSPGVTLCVSDINGVRVYSQGVLGLSDPRPVTGDTVFPIASLTKVFTGLMLSDAILRGEMKLSDPIRLHLPNGFKLPTWKGEEIRLIHLATHTTGFPQEIPNSDEAALTIGVDPNKPQTDFLATYVLPKPLGESWSYSNINYALLGQALAYRTGLSYEELLQHRVCRPLKLHQTHRVGTPNTTAYRASPHLDGVTPAPEWNKPWAPAIQSTTEDLGRFVSYASGIRTSPLAPAFAAMLTTRHPAPFLGGDQLIGWGEDRTYGAPRIMFAGRNPGFTSGMMYDPQTRLGVAALCNSSLMIEPIAREVLRPGYLAWAAAGEANAGGGLPPDPAIDRLVGRYAYETELRDARMPAGSIVVFQRTDAGFTAVLPRYPRAPLKQTAPDTFVIDGFPVKFVFPAGEGPAASVRIVIDAETAEAKRQ